MYTNGVRAEYYVNEITKKKEKQIFTAYYIIKAAVDVLLHAACKLYINLFVLLFLAGAR